MRHTRWFKDKVFYQIWPRSFRDGNGDGIGDLWGVLEKLDYLKELGIDGVWFSPLYPSPGADCGYDISDYMDIAPEYGGMEAFRAVLDGLHERGMKLVMDLVVNHTSDEHEWFQKSRRRIAPYTDYYIWRSAKPNGKLPNNWDSHFEGKAWQWDDLRQEYYLHLVAVKQPDLNMDNLLVRTEVKKILKFWLDLGVDGFREDVITFISKKEGLPDDYLFPVFKGIRFYNHGPHIHEYLQEFRRDVLENYDCMTIAEAPLVTPQRALDYIEESDTNEIDMMIQFQCVCADCFFTDYMPRKFSLKRLRRAFSSWQTQLDGRGWNALYLENHDHPRVISRYGSEQYRVESGKMLAVSYLFLKGTPFIYQGQELGLANVDFASIDEINDVESRNLYQELCGKMPSEEAWKRILAGTRDHARAPMPWNAGPNGGFTAGTPWLRMADGWQTCNAADEMRDPDSVFHYYKKLIALRRENPALVYGAFRPVFLKTKRHADVFCYFRVLDGRKFYVECNLTAHQTPRPAPLSGAQAKRIGNYAEEAPVLRPYEANVYEVL